jgi:ATP-dependent Clp protease ATP-binding subunit ClpX
MKNKSLGFQAEIKPSRQRHNEAFEKLEPEDLMRYGLIPEFVGRLPVLGVLHELDEKALVNILTKPKNALLKQYQRKFEFDNVRLKFSDDAVKAVAHQAFARKVGARGLMMIMEEILLDPMYVLPSQRKVKELIITKEMVERKAATFDLSLAEVEDAAA